MKKQLFADLSLLAVVIVWGYTFVAIKNALDGVTPFNFIALRFILALIILLVVFRKRLSGLNRYIMLRGSIVGVFLFFAYAFQTAGNFTAAFSSARISSFSFFFCLTPAVTLRSSKPTA